MMDGKLVKCNYCNTTVLLRFQMGYFDIPFDICCPNCKVHISGIRAITKQHRFDIKNANVVDEDKEQIDYFSDFSVELPSHKIKKYESIESLVNSGFSPFMVTAQLFGFENYEKLMKNISGFISIRDKLWQRLSAFYDVYFENRIDLLKPQLIKISKAYVVENKLDISMALHQLLVISFNSILPDNSLCEFTQYGEKIIRSINSRDILLLIQKLDEKAYFDQNGKRILDIISRWNSKFEVFIPAVMLSLGQAKEKINKEEYGIASTSYEFFKNFYSDSYELILDLIDIPVGLNNISERGSVDSFPTDSICKDFVAYRKLTKGEKIKKLSAVETFSKPMELNRNVRNAIGHFNFNYDVATQKITFKDKYKGKENDVTMYLLDLACLCYENIVILFYLNELMYTLRKIDYTSDGFKPHIGVISEGLNLEE